MFWHVWRGGGGSLRLYTWIIGCKGRKMPGKCFYFHTAAHGLNCCGAELILHRICVNGGNTTCHCEIAGPLSHPAPDSIVYCLCPGVEPPTYKPKVWARSWGHLGRSVVQTLRRHRHGQGTVPDSCSPHCKSSQTCWPAAAVIKATMPGPSMSLHPVQMAFQFVCSVVIRVHFSS